MPGRPLPPQPENKFPPPQQSEEEEKASSNRPGEPELLRQEPAILLGGKPFPEKRNYEPHFPASKRDRFVNIELPSNGDGSEAHPWNDLQKALCALEPGDRLVLAAGIYTGSFRVGSDCHDGTAEWPIQVYSRHAFLKPSGAGDLLTIERAHWQFWEVQLALLDSDVAGLVLKGKGAHDDAIDQSHIYEGKGPAVIIGEGADHFTMSNCHIHQSRGVRIDAGTQHVTLVNNHIHHNRGTSVTIGDGSATTPASEITLMGNRFHNDHGAAVEISHAANVRLFRNRVSNYRPDEDDGSGGDAILIGGGSSDISLEENSILESTTAIHVGGRNESGSAPHHITVTRNYFENQLTPESTTLRVDRGHHVAFESNVINRYADPFVVSTTEKGAVTIANNLVVKPARAWMVASPSSLAFFDYNVFGADDSLKSSDGKTESPASAWMVQHMPHSQIIPGADLANHDLTAVVGFAGETAGRSGKGIAFLAPVKNPDDH
jgi:hypothetical protein